MYTAPLHAYTLVLSIWIPILFQHFLYPGLVYIHAVAIYTDCPIRSITVKGLSYFSFGSISVALTHHVSTVLIQIRIDAS